LLSMKLDLVELVVQLLCD